MKTFRLFLGLLWRIAVLYLVFGATLAALIVAASALGLQLPTKAWLHSPDVIRAKPSALLLGFALFLTVAAMVLRKPPLYLVAGRKLQVPPDSWKKSTLFLVGLASGVALTSLPLAYITEPEVWVFLKSIGNPLIELGALYLFARGIVSDSMEATGSTVRPT